MPQVTVTIAGRSYRMACDEGQEDHLRGLGQTLDGKIEDIRSSFGEIGDMRLTVMAAIVLADELSEATRRIARLEEEISEVRENDGSEAQRLSVQEKEATLSLSRMAERMEKVAHDINQRMRRVDNGFS
jgi:cell division protein ZapA